MIIFIKLEIPLRPDVSAISFSNVVTNQMATGVFFPSL